MILGVMGLKFWPGGSKLSVTREYQALMGFALVLENATQLHLKFLEND